MGDRYVNRQNRFTDNSDSKSFRVPASQMAEHGEAWTKFNDQKVHMVHRRKQPIWLCNDAKTTL